jgi:hypothetical protein
VKRIGGALPQHPDGFVLDMLRVVTVNLPAVGASELDELHPPAVHHPMVGPGGDGHSPAEVIDDTETHGADCAPAATGITGPAPAEAGHHIRIWSLRPQSFGWPIGW